MAKIGIDARLWGTKHGGIGRYTEELVRSLQTLDRKNKYTIFCKSEDKENIPNSSKWHKVVADVKHYTIAEQTEFLRILNKENLDLVHFQHFNVPVLYNGKFIVTIHDLIWHDIKGLNATNQPALFYFIKYLSYRFVVKRILKKAAKIIVPSNTIKNDLLGKFKLLASKVEVTYEGVTRFSSTLINQHVEVLKKYGVCEPYLLYVGSLYPHKNVENMVRATKMNLVVVSARNVFFERFAKFLKGENAQEYVKVLTDVPDKDLFVIYKKAEAFVFPSLAEGFGLPGLEAMSAGIPLICSDIPVFREIYTDAAVYFDPGSCDDIAKKIQHILLNSNDKKDLLVKEKERVKLFSWGKMAKETLGIYTSTV